MSGAKPSALAAPVLALIPARSGSKGIPGKNSRILAGKPLIGHAIETAASVRMFDRIILTTDSEELAALGRSFGAETPFLRPPELAADDTPMLAVVQHAVRMVSEMGWTPEIIVLLQPTAPFRRREDIVGGLTLLQRSPEVDSVVSVELVPSHYSPDYVMKVVNNRLLPFLNDGVRPTQRQSVPPAYSRNGQFYIVRRTTLFEMNSIYGDHSVPYVTTHKAVNLDTLDDWEVAERRAHLVQRPSPTTVQRPSPTTRD